MISPKTNVTLFCLLKCLYRALKVHGHVLLLGDFYQRFTTSYLLDSGIVPTVWYCLYVQSFLLIVGVTSATIPLLLFINFIIFTQIYLMFIFNSPRLMSSLYLYVVFFKNLISMKQKRPQQQYKLAQVNHTHELICSIFIHLHDQNTQLN